jgi:hypothetical protein
MYKRIRDMRGQIREDMISRPMDNVFIPRDKFNRDWVQYEKWLEEGNQPEDADPLPEEVDHNDFNNWPLFLKAKAISDLAYRLNKQPNELTAAEIGAERARIKNIAERLT